MGIDTTQTAVRVFPLIAVDPAELAEIVGEPIVGIERIDGGLTNTIHKVALSRGDSLGVKHYAGGRQWFETELTTLTLLHGTIPVPEIVHVDEARQVIVYRWIVGVTLHQLRTGGHKDAFAALAEPLGGVLANLARTDAEAPYELTPILDRAYTQLAGGRAAERIGVALCDRVRRMLEAAEPEMAFGAVCLSHGDLNHRNILAARADNRWQISGVIDWEATSTSSPLADIGSLFRYGRRHDATFRAEFERGYRAAGGDLPPGWCQAARLLDATELVAVLDEPRDMPEVYADCKKLLEQLAASA